MQVLSLKVMAKTDPGPLYPECTGKTVHELNLDRLAVLEAGTQSGACSVMISVDLPDGSVGMIQMSARAFLMMASGVKGAMARFGEAWDGVQI